MVFDGGPAACRRYAGPTVGSKQGLARPASRRPTGRFSSSELISPTREDQGYYRRNEQDIARRRRFQFELWATHLLGVYVGQLSALTDDATRANAAGRFLSLQPARYSR